MGPLKSFFYAASSVFIVSVAAWQLWSGFSTGRIELPAARGHEHHSVQLADAPGWFWSGAALWLLILGIATFLLVTIVRPHR